MSLSRRAVLAGLAGSLAGAALAEAPLTSPRPQARPSGAAAAGFRDAPKVLKANARAAADLVAEARLGGEISFVVADARTGLILEARDATAPMPPASTAKAITSLYALETLGPGYRFPTRLVATGPVAGGRIAGDLILAGGGDPTLSTDHLGEMAMALRKAGVTGVSGRFLVWGGALPYVAAIDPGQPDWFGYNPSVSGINLNFNRVNFVWKRAQDGYEIGMDARGERFAPPVYSAEIRIAERDLPIYTYAGDGPREEWTVSRAALGKNGSRWLPVRRPEAYAGDVFRTLARAQGVSLPEPDRAERAPQGGTAIVERSSDALPAILRDMMKFSTNLTAEAVGMAASLRMGAKDHDASGRMMTDWVRRRAGLTEARLVDHSGLRPESRICASEMVRALVTLGPGVGLRGLMKEVPVNEKGKQPLPGLKVEAKTGTLNFVSALAGYMTGPGGADLAFAIFTGDIKRRDAIPPAQREQPEGNAAWVKRSKRLQAQLIERWATVYGG